MPPRLLLEHGPLGPDRLDAIAATYGTVDPRYASRAFCELIFNGNPYGFSWHAFIVDGDRVVGHYAVIPMRVCSDHQTVLSGKGEALFLAEDHRAGTVETDSGMLPAGLALMNALHDHALADGAILLFATIGKTGWWT